MAGLGLSNMGSKLRKVVRVSPNEVPTPAGDEGDGDGDDLIVGLHCVDLRGKDGIRAQAQAQAMTAWRTRS